MYNSEVIYSRYIISENSRTEFIIHQSKYICRQSKQVSNRKHHNKQFNEKIISACFKRISEHVVLTIINCKCHFFWSEMCPMSQHHGTRDTQHTTRQDTLDREESTQGQGVKPDQTQQYQDWGKLNRTSIDIKGYGKQDRQVGYKELGEGQMNRGHH